MRLFAATLVVCASVLIGLASQDRRTAVSITGQVLDQAGVAVAGATVRLTRPAFTTRSALTDARGRFTFNDVPPATYVVQVSLTGFVPLERTVLVTADQAGSVSVTLSLIADTETPRTRDLAAKAAPREPSPVDQQASAPELRSDASARVPRPAAEGVPGGVAGGVVGGLPSSPPPATAAPYPYPDSRRRDPWNRPRHPINNESYDRIRDNAFRSTGDEPLSTFSIDVDTASYANVRRMLNGGTMPPADAVRIEELINYFRFDYPQPSRSAPFSVTTELSACPWNPRHRLALIGLQAQRLDDDKPQRRNLVFLLDVSGSMEPEDKLPLIRRAMRMLVATLKPQDRIAIVVYAGASGVVLPTTPGDHKELIHQAIARLQAGGSTNGGAGITLAYKIAREQFIRGGINRVILATDGDFNVGITDQRDLVRLIEEQRDAGIFLSVLGVGTGNLKDSTMEKLADKGNGNYSYLDSLYEAQKVLVAEAGGTLVTVAKDVKIQVEFNPAHVAAYRLVGYENRLLRDEDFNNDRKDAGEIGAGHTVTALYELVPTGAEGDLPRGGVDPLRYQQTPQAPKPSVVNEYSHELMTVKLRYKDPEGETSRLLTFPIVNRTSPLSDNIGFAAAVAEFGMLLRRSEHKGASTYQDAAALARRHRGRDESGYRAEFVRLVELAEALTRQSRH